MPFDARVRILLVEDDPEDHLLTAAFLHDIEGWEPELDWASTYEDGLRMIEEVHYDVALVDYRLGARTGVDFVGEDRVRATGTPVIILTGQGGREVDLEATRAGAVDYLHKGELRSVALERSIRYAVEARRRTGMEARFKALIENGRDLIAVLEPDGTARYVSPSLVRVLGYDPEEIVGTDVMGEVHPEDRPEVERAFQLLLEDPASPRKMQYRARHRDGSWRVLDTVAQNLTADPDIGGIVVNSWEVTELHRTGAALRERQAELQERIKELRCLYRVQSVLQALEGSWEATLQEVVDAIPPGFQFPERMGASLRLEGRTSETPEFRETSWCLETDVRVAGEHVGDLRVCFLEAPPGEPDEPFLAEERPLVEAVANRVAEALARRSAEEELEASEAFHRALIEQSGLVVAVVDREGGIRHVSGEVLSLLGAEPDDLVGRDVAEVVAPDAPEAVEGLVEAAIGEPGVTHEGVVRREGTAVDERHVECSVRSLLDTREVDGIVVTLRDVTARVRQEGRIRFQSELLERVGQPVFASDAEGRVTYWNRAAERTLGWRRDEMVGESVMDRIVPPELVGEVLGIREQVGSGDPWEGEIKLRGKDGSDVIVRGTVTPVRDADGSPTGRIVAGADITELRRTEAELTEQRELLAGVASNAPAILFAIDAGGRIRLADGRGFAALGMEPRSMVGRNVSEVFEDRAEFLDDVRRAQAGETFRTVRELFGRAFETWWSPLGATGGAVGVSVDVTERDRAARRIRFQADLLDAVGQAVIATDLDGTVTYWNRGAERLYGWTRDEAMGGSILDLTPSDLSRDEAVAILAGLRAGESWTGEMEVNHRDGTTFPALITDAPIRGAEGRVVGIVGVSQDVSERKALETELRQAQKMEAIGRLAGGVAHDFNNLLTAIRGHAELLLQDLDPDSTFRDEVVHIRTAGERAAELTRHLLAFSRKQVLEDRILDLGQVIREMEPMLKRLIPASVELTFDTSGESAPVRADPGQVQQVVLNLALNAGDAMRDHGYLSIGVDSTTLSAAEAEAVPWTVEPGPYVRLSVSDTGTGIGPEDLPHIFEPFFTTKEEGKGTGLGLSTVFGIVKQSGGHIFVESDIGKGTTFRVLLPRREGESTEREPPPQPLAFPRGSAGEQETVLLVEDDDSVRRLSRRVLERAGFEVVEARNGREALEIAGRSDHRVGVVVSDVVMPEMGGTRLTDLLREHYPELRVVLTSGYSEEELLGEVRGRSAAFLGKPFAPDELVRVVRQTLAEGPREEA